MICSLVLLTSILGTDAADIATARLMEDGYGADVAGVIAALKSRDFSSRMSAFSFAKYSLTPDEIEENVIPELDGLLADLKPGLPGEILRLEALYMKIAYDSNVDAEKALSIVVDAVDNPLTGEHISPACVRSILTILVTAKKKYSVDGKPYLLQILLSDLDVAVEESDFAALLILKSLRKYYSVSSEECKSLQNRWSSKPKVQEYLSSDCGCAHP